MKCALLCFYKKLDLQEALENLPDVDHMFLGGAGEDKDVIKVDKDELVQHVMENIINQSLEHSRGVGKVKWHDQILIVS
jgi:signal transduction histidine kinase